MKHTGWLIGLALLLAGCSSSTGSVDPANLQAGTYWVQVAGDETSVFTGETVAVQAGSDIQIELILNDAEGKRFAVILFALPSDLFPDTYQICYLDFYELDQCSNIGVEYQQLINGVLTRQKEFGSGSMEIISVNPLTASFRLAPNFEDGTGAIATGAMNQIPVR